MPGVGATCPKTTPPPMKRRSPQRQELVASKPPSVCVQNKATYASAFPPDALINPSTDVCLIGSRRIRKTAGSQITPKMGFDPGFSAKMRAKSSGRRELDSFS